MWYCSFHLERRIRDPLNPGFEKYNLSFSVLNTEPFLERIFKTKFQGALKRHQPATFGTRFKKIGLAMKVGQRSREMESQTPSSFLALSSLNALNRFLLILCQNVNFLWYFALGIPI